MTSAGILTDLQRAVLHLNRAGHTVPCQDHNGADLWLSDDPDDRAAAAHWCEGCPVLTACAESADAHGERFGVWAGRDRGTRTPRPVS